MAGVTDGIFRYICKLYGAALVYTEMVSVKGLMYNNKKTFELCDITQGERPCAVQIFGSDPEIMAREAKRIEDTADVVDINFGCPASKVVKNNEGSILMSDPQLIGRIVNAVFKAIKKPLTIKIRSGVDSNNINAPLVAKVAEHNGVSAVAVHGRTMKQLYKGACDLSVIRRVKESVSIPVFGSGDVDSIESAQRMFDETKCDAILIGRAAIGNPFIFRELDHFFSTGERLKRPTKEDKIALAKKHLDLAIKIKGAGGIREMRKQMFQYIKGMENSTKIRAALSITENANQIYELLECL
jgi:tRNA-dihydrouridine synthase B